MSFDLFRDDETALYMQLANSIRNAIFSGQLRSGDKLPSVRKLSDEQGVNPATVVSAYRILSTEGLLESRLGSGVFVSQNITKKEGFISKDDIYDIANKNENAEKIKYDLSLNSPMRDFYPLEDIKHFVIELIDDGRAFDYQDADGYMPLRQILAERLDKRFGNSEGKIVLEDIHITSGAQQAIDLVSRIILRHGDVAVVENPGYVGSRSAFIANGAKLISVNMKKDGIDVDEIENLAKKTPLRLLYVNPDFQNPTCICYSLEKRKQLVKLAHSYGFYIIEDDTFSALHFDGNNSANLRTFDDGEHIFYITSFSKTIMPGLRIACLDAPKIFRKRIEQAKRSIDLSSNGLMQRLLERLISQGKYDEHVIELRKLCTLSCNAFCETLSLDNPNGGLNMWIKLPENITGKSFSKMCLEHSIKVVPECFFRAANSNIDNHIRLSFGSVNQVDAKESALILKKLLVNKN